METYKNKNGYPIIRSCVNCTHFRTIKDMEKMGYCKLMPLIFAYTFDKSVYAMVKTFYLCEKHELQNEEFLKENGQKVCLTEILKLKCDLR